ncbi:MAG: hypothetical protein NTU53_03825 [Planctomycetota bacterium]|nr:hypothetical protein [Planctomycetota bacterium]
MESQRFDLRFAVLRHEGVGEGHFDIMFQTTPGSKLATWRSAQWPLSNGTIVEPVPDHRAEYLEYEGEVSRGRGFVKRVTAGRHLVREDRVDRLVVELEDGQVLSLWRSGQRKAQVTREL